MKKTIKIIDLLKKIANGEEVPKKIIYEDKTFDYINSNRDGIKYVNENKVHGELGRYLIYCVYSLNDEVEIIEEDKKIEIDENGYLHTSEGAFKGRKMDIAFADKINEIIDTINELRKGE